MIPVQIRKQGSSAIITLPVAALKIMGEEVGNTLLLDVERGKLTAISTKEPERRRYKLSELLDGVTQESMDELNEASAHVQEGAPVCKELL